MDMYVDVHTICLRDVENNELTKNSIHVWNCELD